MKLRDWPGRLNNYIAEQRGKPFQYGITDCALFACGAIMAQTGEHPAPEFVGAYDDAESAAQALRELGAGTLKKTADRILGKSNQVATSHAQRGDIVMWNDALGVCMGSFAVFLRPEGDYARAPRSEWKIAWRVS